MKWFVLFRQMEQGIALKIIDADLEAALYVAQVAFREDYDGVWMFSREVDLREASQAVAAGEGIGSLEGAETLFVPNAETLFGEQI